MPLPMKRQGTVKPKVRNASKVLLFVATILFGCKASKVDGNNFQGCKDCYDVKRFAKKDKDAYESTILFNYYDFHKKNQIIPFRFVGFVIIDDFVFRDSIVEIHPRDGQVDVLISTHLKETILIKDLKVSKGDSIVIDAYLKDSETILE